MNGTPEIQPLKASDIAQTMLFKTIWDRMPKRSFLSRLWLRCYTNTPLWLNCFCYVLPVEKYRYFKYYAGNVVLMTPGERGLWVSGTEEERIAYALDIEEKSRGTSTANWNAVKELEVDLKKIYIDKFPSTKGMFIDYHYTLDEQKRILSKLNMQFWDSFEK